MKSRVATLLAVLFLSLPAARALALCEDWTAGPLRNDIGPNGANWIVLAQTTWDPDGTGPLQPRLVVAGAFTSVEGVDATDIAMRDPATGEWSPLGSGLSGQVMCMTVYNGDLIVAGTVATAGGVAVNEIARWDGGSWHALGSGISGTYVRCLTVYNGELIAGGTFNQAGGVGVNNIARWDGSSWHALGSGLSGLYAISMAAWNGELVVGGVFTQAGGVNVNNVARWNGSTWLAMAAGVTGSVDDFQPYNGALVAAVGTTSGGGPAAYLSSWNGSSWSSSATFVGMTMHDLTVYDGALMLGCENLSGGQYVNGIYSWTGSTFQQLGGGIIGRIYAVTVWNDELVAGGNFTQADGRRANYLARWNGYDWGPFGWGTATSVNAMTLFQGRIVAGGDFHQSASNGLSIHRLAAWDGTGMSPMGPGMNGTVLALTSFRYSGIFGKYELLAGGAFTHAGTVDANRVARWQVDPRIAFPPPQWNAMGNGFNGEVRALERYSNGTYAGGSFTASGATGLSYIAKWNESSGAWEPLGSGMNGMVYALKSYGGYLYAGGSFTSAGGVGTGGLARWNGSSWGAVGGFFNGTVYALEVHDNQLVIGGSYPGINSSPNLAQYDGASYSTFGMGGTDAPVRSLHSSGTRLYVGGDFSTAGGVPAHSIAYWDGSWQEPYSGLDGAVLAMATWPNELHAGGTMDIIPWNGAISPRWARYEENGLPWFAGGPSSQSVDAGTDVSFTATPGAGLTGLSFQWLRDDAPVADGPTGLGSSITGSTSQTLSISTVGTGDQAGYRLVLTNSCGSDTSLTATLTVAAPTAAPGSGRSTVFESLGPNPTGGSSQLDFSLAHDAAVQVDVYDLRGRRVRRLDLGVLPAGEGRASWNGRDGTGARVASGVYFVTLMVDGRPVGNKRLTVLN